MKITKENKLPGKNGYWEPRLNFAVELENGKKYYGFTSYDQAQKAFIGFNEL